MERGLSSLDKLHQKADNLTSQQYKAMPHSFMMQYLIFVLAQIPKATIFFLAFIRGNLPFQ